ncbi:hypothetical protein BP6252_13634 [Coleophoma cylindrospora]|uniref:NADP-dependent oxidoreductase domain-containing protein n=1 Tax=Coleophoma cylindrospora TaxID=1849047 RepID=A0A3D8Q8R4_9HELO|nr:hypothetical protein BP6252_13634 [Coleophoma cylindrospora]
MAVVTGKAITDNGLGLMKLVLPNDVTPDDVIFPVLKTALECGANVWNGADFYGTPDHNSLHLMNRYFTKYPEDADKVVLSIKGGVVSIATYQVDASPEFMRTQVDSANKILDGKKTIDLFGPARVDPNVPIERTVEELAQLVKEGKIGGIQLCEVRADTIRRASKVARIDMIEAEVSLWSTDIFNNGVAETCAELNISIQAYAPLGSGMLTGQIKSIDDLPTSDRRRLHFPRYQPENLEKNLALVRELEKFAGSKGCSLAELALSWVKSGNGKAGKPFVVPIAGARSEKRVRENCAAIDLSEEDLEKIATILDSFPVAGERYPAKAMEYSEY